MNRCRYTIVAVLLIICLSSCGDDFFSTVIEVDPPKHEPLIVSQFFVNDEEPIAGAFVGRTYPVLRQIDFEETHLADAKVELYKNGMHLTGFTYDPNIDGRNNFWADSQFVIDDATEYELRVSHEGYPSVSAKQRMPSEVKIISTNLIEDDGVDIDGIELSRVELTLEDPPNVENYYEIAAVIVDPVSGGRRTIYTRSIDVTVEESYNTDALLVSDVGFDGNEHKLRLNVDRYFYDELSKNGYVYVASLTKDMYRYSRSLRIYLDSEDFGIFSEPAIIHSNLDGGLGCFGMIRSQLLPLK